jgi:hypothetical protein
VADYGPKSRRQAFRAKRAANRRLNAAAGEQPRDAAHVDQDVVVPLIIASPGAVIPPFWHRSGLPTAAHGFLTLWDSIRRHH